MNRKGEEEEEEEGIEIERKKRKSKRVQIMNWMIECNVAAFASLANWKPACKPVLTQKEESEKNDKETMSLVSMCQCFVGHLVHLQLTFCHD